MKEKDFQTEEEKWRECVVNDFKLHRRQIENLKLAVIFAIWVGSLGIVFSVLV